MAAEDHAAVLKLWAKRRRDLGSLRTQVACRLHAVLCDLVPGGHPKKEITAAQAAHALAHMEPAGAVETARHELALEFLEDLRRIDGQMRETKKRLEVAVKASGTTVTEVFGVGPYVAGTVIGYVCDVSRFLNRDHFAAYNGTAPIEVSSGNHKIFRLSRRGNRRLNHAVHMAAVTQVRFRHSEGRAYYDRKVKEGKTHKEALRCLKRRISDAIFAHLVADAKRKAQAVKGPGRANGERLCRQRGRFTPRAPALRTGHSRARPHHRAEAHAHASERLGAGREKISKSLLTTKRPRYARIHLETPVFFSTSITGTYALCAPALIMRRAMHTARGCPKGELALHEAPTPARRGPGLDSDGPRLGHGLAAPFSGPAGTGDLQPGRPDQGIIEV